MARHRRRAFWTTRRRGAVTGGVLGLALVLSLTATSGAPGQGSGARPATAAPALRPAAATSTRWVERPRGTYAVTRITRSYGNYGANSLYDAYLPVGEPTRRRPMVIVIPGGGWNVEDKASGGRWAADLASRGYATFSIQHRLSTQKLGRWAAQRDDAIAAVTAIRRGWSRWGGVPTRIALVGSSSGGSLALHASRQYGVVAVAAWSPSIDFYRIVYVDNRRVPEYSQRIRYQLMRCGITVCRSLWQGSYPAAPHIPTLITVSKYEYINPIPAANFVNRVRSFGVPSRLYVRNAYDHGGEAYMQEIWPITRYWLSAYLNP